MLATEQAIGVWDYYLGISDDFLDALFLIRACPTDASPGRICRSDVSIKVIAFALRGLAQGGSQDLYCDWKRSFFAM